MDYVLRFGKYSGTSLGVMTTKQPQYLLWLRQQDWIKDDLIVALSEVYFSILMPYGKYKGRTLKDIRSADPKYYTWFIEKQHPTRPEMNAAIETEVV